MSPSSMRCEVHRGHRPGRHVYRDEMERARSQEEETKSLQGSRDGLDLAWTSDVHSFSSTSSLRPLMQSSESTPSLANSQRSRPLATAKATGAAAGRVRFESRQSSRTSAQPTADGAAGASGADGEQEGEEEEEEEEDRATGSKASSCSLSLRPLARWLSGTSRSTHPLAVLQQTTMSIYASPSRFGAAFLEEGTTDRLLVVEDGLDSGPFDLVSLRQLAPHLSL